MSGNIRIIFTLGLGVLGFFLSQTVSIPVDLYHTGVIDPNDYRQVRKPDPGPGLCRENVNNDNITNIKWYRYHNATHKCYHIDERGPCGKLMLFYAVGDTDYGDCDCILYYRCARPLIYWPSENRCYYTNGMGPCKKEEWFVLDSQLQPSCQANPCVQSETQEPSTYDRYWFEEGGQCYKTLTQGYCNGSQEVLYTKWDEPKPSCNVGRVCNSRNTRATAMSCVPGQKHDMMGNCRGAIRLDMWSQLRLTLLK